MSEQSILGFLNVNKPLGLTSHDVVAQVRRTLKRDKYIAKVGHAGTLDPMATGVLVVCLGPATRLSEYVMDTTKCYQATIQLGVVTDTYDAEGEIVRENDALHITREQVDRALLSFIGEVKQIPPMYSAIKQGGRKLYEVARAGEFVERKPRLVRIDSLRIVNWAPPKLTIDVICSRGTYIRSLAYDLGETLGIGAHLAGLIRIASGKFVLEDATSLDVLATDKWTDKVVSPAIVFNDWFSLTLDDIQAKMILEGKYITRNFVGEMKHAIAYTRDGHFLAILDAQGSLWKPHKVFPPKNG